MSQGIKNRLLFSAIMALFTASIMTFIILAYNLGIIPGFLAIWFKSFLLAYFIIVPFVLIIGPLVQRFVDKLLLLSESNNP